MHTSAPTLQQQQAVKARAVVVLLQQGRALAVRARGWMQMTGQQLQQQQLVLVMTWRELMMLLSLQTP